MLSESGRGQGTDCHERSRNISETKAVTIISPGAASGLEAAWCCQAARRVPPPLESHGLNPAAANEAGTCKKGKQLQKYLRNAEPAWRHYAREAAKTARAWASEASNLERRAQWLRTKPECNRNERSSQNMLQIGLPPGNGFYFASRHGRRTPSLESRVPNTGSRTPKVEEAQAT